MTDNDRGLVIDWLEEIVSDPEGWQRFYSSSEQKLLAEDALAMLEEQEDRINDLKGFSKDAVPVVRCKDCKYYIPYEWMFDGLSRSSNRNDYTPDEIGCAVNDHNYPPEGFCSNAERKIDESD